MDWRELGKILNRNGAMNERLLLFPNSLSMVNCYNCEYDHDNKIYVVPDSFKIDYIEISDNISLYNLDILKISYKFYDHPLFSLQIPFYLILAYSSEIKSVNGSKFIKFNNALFGIRCRDNSYHEKNSLPLTYSSKISIKLCSKQEIYEHSRFNVYIKHHQHHPDEYSKKIPKSYICRVYINKSISFIGHKHSFDIRHKYLSSGIFLKAPEIQSMYIQIDNSIICKYDEKMMDLYIKKMDVYNNLNDEQLEAFIKYSKNVLPKDIINIIVNMLNKMERKYVYWVPFIDPELDGITHSPNQSINMGNLSPIICHLIFKDMAKFKEIEYSLLSWNEIIRNDNLLNIKYM